MEGNNNSESDDRFKPLIQRRILKNRDKSFKLTGMELDLHNSD